MNSRRPPVAPLVAALALLLAGLWPAFSSVQARTEAGAQPAQAEPLPAIPRPDLSKAVAVAVAGVVDGDTITVVRGGQRETVRLLGVDTPETKDPRKEVQFYGKEASDFLTNLLKGEAVYVVPEAAGAKDRYGRTLAHVYRAPDGLWVNLEIVRQGYGQVYSGDAFKDINLFLVYQRRAREAEKGLWSPGANPDAPRDRAVVPTPIPVKPAEKPGDASKPAPEKVTVYVTKSGSKYHRAGCSYLKSSSIPIDLVEAKGRYGACSRCGPPR